MCAFLTLGSALLIVCLVSCDSKLRANRAPRDLRVGFYDPGTISLTWAPYTVYYSGKADDYIGDAYSKTGLSGADGFFFEGRDAFGRARMTVDTASWAAGEEVMLNVENSGNVTRLVELVFSEFSSEADEKAQISIPPMTTAQYLVVPSENHGSSSIDWLLVGTSAIRGEN